MCVAWLAPPFVIGGDAIACGEDEESCVAEARLLAQLDSDQRTALEQEGATWAALGVEDPAEGRRHLFLGSRLLEGCTTRLRVAAFLQALILDDALDVASMRESSGITDEAIATSILSIWRMESLWGDGLRNEKAGLLRKGVVADWDGLMTRLIEAGGLDGAITWSLIENVPQRVLPAVTGCLRAPRFECERLWAASLITNAGQRVGREELTGVAGGPSDMFSNSRQRLVKSILAGEHVTWDQLFDAGCWE
jgi:hypothetical protein